MDILEGIAANLSATARFGMIAYAAGFITCAVIALIL